MCHLFDWFAAGSWWDAVPRGGGQGAWQSSGEALTPDVPTVSLDLLLPSLSTDGAANPGEAGGQRKPRR